VLEQQIKSIDAGKAAGEINKPQTWDEFADSEFSSYGSTAQAATVHGPTFTDNITQLDGAKTGDPIALTGFRQASKSGQIPATGTFYAVDPALAGTYGNIRQTAKVGELPITGGAAESLNVVPLKMQNPLVIDGGHQILADRADEFFMPKAASLLRAAKRNLNKTPGEKGYLLFDKAIHRVAAEAGYDGVIFRRVTKEGDKGLLRNTTEVQMIEPANGVIPDIQAAASPQKVQAMQQGAVATAKQMPGGVGGPAILKMAKEATVNGDSKESLTANYRALSDAIEGGSTPEQFMGLRNAIKKIYKKWADTEVEYGGLTPMAGHYAPHLVTKAGKGFFGQIAKDEALSVQFIQAIDARRATRGLEPLKILDRTAPVDRAIQNKGIAKTLDDIGLTDNFLEETIHGSKYSRKYSGVTITELNDIAKQLGFSEAIFDENPFRQLYARGLRHAKVRGAIDFVEGISGFGMGKKLTAADDIVSSSAYAKVPGVSQVTLKDGTQGFASDVVRGKDKAPVVFKDAKGAIDADHAMRYFQDDKSLHEALNWYDQVTRLYKVALTRGFPAFHMRNRFENRIKSHMEDVPFMGAHNGAAAKAVGGKDFEIALADGTTMTRQSMMQELSNMPEHGVMNSGHIESIMQEAGDIAAGQVKKAETSWNPFSVNSKYLKVMEKVGTIPTAAPGMAWHGVADQIPGLDGNIIETTDKVRHYIYKRMEGYAPQEAAANTMKAQFDYRKSAMNHFEREVMDRGIMFYGYTRSVIPYMVEKMFTSTNKVAPWLKAANHPGKDEHLPPWLREGMSVPLYKDETGQQVILRSMGTPIEAAIEPFAGFEQGIQRGVSKLGSRINPMPKALIELMSGKDLFLGRDIDALRKLPNWVGSLPSSVQDALSIRSVKNKLGQHMRYEGSAWGSWMLRNSPASRFSGTLSKGMDERKAGWDIGANLLTGSNITSFDPARERRYREREAAISQLKELESQGMVREIKNVYGSTDAGKGNEEVSMLLNLLRGK